MRLTAILQRIIDLLASVKVAIPLLVLIAAASVAGTVIPQGGNVRLARDAPVWLQELNRYLQLNDVFHSAWFLTLVSLLGLSLLSITAKRVPALWRKKGAHAGLGILLAHVGILIVLGGAAYGSVNGFRYYVHLIEGEVTVVPALPFVIRLDELDLAFFPPEAFEHRGTDNRVVERQNSEVTLMHHGSPFMQTTVAPGRPVTARGVTLLPSEGDLGWVFDLVLEAGGHEKVVPVRPWAPPLITLGLGNRARILAHRLTPAPEAIDRSDPAPDDLRTEILLLDTDGSSRSLGFASRSQPVVFEAWTISVGEIRRHTGLHAYSRPEMPLLVTGVATLLVGLTGAFTRWGLRLLPRRFRTSPRDSRSLPGTSVAAVAGESRGA